ncbi:MAG TPA: amidophosphoribosyltransferase [Candidatus Cloacimonadota bacterium]|nr:amidophosphoribosyltransferase [Candidatus Cloacimonadota bacterium]HPT71523.1 amidophosphoribosyltransferase [Candidatus Cloacimonadota bacterium]
MCGIIGIFNHENAAGLAALGMFAEQHRGQESCGMAVNDGKHIRIHKRMGLVKEVFPPELLENLEGRIAIGHVRYPTKGSATEYNTQPHLVNTFAGPSYALASNGDIINYQEVRSELEAKGVVFASENDGELILKYIVFQIEKEGLSIVDAIKQMMRRVKGAYSTVMSTQKELYMIRDPYAIRPMVWGIRSDGTVVVASESCALDILEVENRYEVPSAGIMIVNENGIQTMENDPDQYRYLKSNKHCVFEQIYFSRPDSFHFGENVYSVREKIGNKLADGDKDWEPDHALPVPDSSNFIGLGYANGKRISFGLGLIRNHYVGRTFIKPEQTIRDESVKQKFNPLPNFFPGKKVVLIDDSIVRGTTIHKIVKMLKDAGAGEVHLRIGSPQVKYSCFYGIDTPNKTDLIANQKTLEEIREYSGADSLKYLSLDDLKSCVTNPEEYCYACFDGNYPVK